MIAHNKKLSMSGYQEKNSLADTNKSPPLALPIIYRLTTYQNAAYIDEQRKKYESGFVCLSSP
jgi:hypothetical protein